MAKPSSRARLRPRVSATGLFARNHLYRSTSSTKSLSTRSFSLRSRVSKAAKRRNSETRSLSKGNVCTVRRAIVHGFQKSIEETRHRIIDHVIASLANTKEDFGLGLEGTILRHRDIANQLQGKRHALLALIQPTASDPIQNKGSDSFGLPDFLVVHYSIAGLERAALRSHWNDWINIQQDIIGLCVEILGPEGVSFAGSGLPAYGIRGAASDFSKHITVSNAFDQKTNKGIRNLARDTQKQLVVQEKKWRDDKKIRRRQMLQLAKQMVACL